MKNHLAVLLCCAAILFIKLIETPGTATGRWFDIKGYPALKHTTREAIRKIPFSNLLDWDGVNDYHPRPTLRPLQVVSPAAAGYTPEELAEIYPTY